MMTHSSGRERGGVTPMIGEHDARYARDLVARICDEVGPGLPASPQELRRAAILEHELEAHLGAGQATFEEFTVAPGAFTASVPIAALLTLVAAMLSAATGRIGVAPWITAGGAVACVSVAMVVLVLEFIYSFEVIDGLFPTRRSVNVIGTLRHPDTREVRRLLLVSGHHDSAPENTWLRALGYAGLVLQGLIPVGLVAMLVLALVQLAGGGTLGRVGWLVLAFPIAPAIVVGLFFTRGRSGGGNVPGAVDNLAASAIAVALSAFWSRIPT